MQIKSKPIAINLRVLIVFAYALLLAGCMPVLAPPKVTKTPLELQALQTREYDSSKKIVFNSVLTVFQDNGYMISSAGMDTGLIVAKSPATQEGSQFTGFTYREQRATAHIDEISSGRTKVRINFVTFERLTYALTRQEHDVPIEDPQIYQDTFIKIQQAVFMKKNVN